MSELVNVPRLFMPLKRKIRQITINSQLGRTWVQEVEFKLGSNRKLKSLVPFSALEPYFIHVQPKHIIVFNVNRVLAHSTGHNQLANVEFVSQPRCISTHVTKVTHFDPGCESCMSQDNKYRSAIYLHTHSVLGSEYLSLTSLLYSCFTFVLFQCVWVHMCAWLLPGNNLHSFSKKRKKYHLTGLLL